MCCYVLLLCASVPPILQYVGDGFCRPSVCGSCSHPYTQTYYCDATIDNCKARCQGIAECRAVAFATTPTTAHDGCQAQGVGRCAVYHGDVDAQGTQFSSSQEYQCWSNPDTAAPNHLVQSLRHQFLLSVLTASRGRYPCFSAVIRDKLF
eukprot:gene17569-biopygen9879